MNCVSLTYISKYSETSLNRTLRKPDLPEYRPTFSSPCLTILCKRSLTIPAIPLNDHIFWSQCWPVLRSLTVFKISIQTLKSLVKKTHLKSFSFAKDDDPRCSSIQNTEKHCGSRPLAGEAVYNLQSLLYLSLSNLHYNRENNQHRLLNNITNNSVDTCSGILDKHCSSGMRCSSRTLSSY
jgi:hypothetical protein